MQSFLFVLIKLYDEKGFCHPWLAHLKSMFEFQAKSFQLSFIGWGLVCLSLHRCLVKWKNRLKNRQGSEVYSLVILWSSRWWRGFKRDKLFLAHLLFDVFDSACVCNFYCSTAGRIYLIWANFFFFIKALWFFELKMISSLIYSA